MQHLKGLRVVVAGRPAVPVDVMRVFWSQIRAGLVIEEAAGIAGVSLTHAKRAFRKAGGVNPIPSVPVTGRYLSSIEREEILSLRAGGGGVREIARALGRNPGTISRVLARGWTGRRGYRPSAAQHKANAARRMRGRQISGALTVQRCYGHRVTGRYGCFGEKLLDDLGVKRTRSRTHSSGLVPRYSGFHADMSLSACALRRGAERHARRRYPRSQHRDIGRMAPGDGWFRGDSWCLVHGQASNAEPRMLRCWRRVSEGSAARLAR